MLVGLAVPLFALSQEAPERGQLGEWVIWEVAPDDAAAFEAVVKKVVEVPAAWRYTPEKPYAEETPMACAYESWMKPGTEMKADEISKEWVAFLKEVGYGYEAFGLRVHFGDVSRFIYVTYFDNKANYFSANSLMKLVEEKGLSEKWSDLGGRWNKLIRRYDETTWTHRADLSYLPSE
jgi:hypothetical protein